MNPPLRLESDRRAVIEGLKSGIITVIATDRASSCEWKNVEDIYKRHLVWLAETSLSVTYLVEAGELSLMELLEKMTLCKPSQAYHNFEAGYLAEMVQQISLFFDARLTALWTPILASRAANSPISVSIKERVKYTICKRTNRLAW